MILDVRCPPIRSIDAIKLLLESFLLQLLELFLADLHIELGLEVLVNILVNVNLLQEPLGDRQFGVLRSFERYL